ncbi:MAG: hypothetical protein PHF56_22510 [Desulfuromonadaceae bacterium]|nr:hypothetical protein [Desulfuromonadaceae bacterium]
MAGKKEFLEVLRDACVKLLDKVIEADFGALYHALKKIVVAKFLYGYIAISVMLAVCFLVLVAYRYFTTGVSKVQCGCILKWLVWCFIAVVVAFPAHLIFLNKKVLLISVVSDGLDVRKTTVELNGEQKKVPKDDGLTEFSVNKTISNYAFVVSSDGSTPCMYQASNDGADSQSIKLDLSKAHRFANVQPKSEFAQPKDVVDVDAFKHLPIEVSLRDYHNKLIDVNYGRVTATLNGKSLKFGRKQTGKVFKICDDAPLKSMELGRNQLSIIYDDHVYSKEFSLYKKMFTTKRYSSAYQFNPKLVSFFDDYAAFRAHSRDKYSQIVFPVELDINKDFTVVYQAAIMQENTCLELEIGDVLLFTVGDRGLDTLSLKYNNLGGGLRPNKSVDIGSLDKKIPLDSLIEVKLNFNSGNRTLSVQMKYDDGTVSKVATQLPIFPDTIKKHKVKFAGTRYAESSGGTDSFSARVSSITVSNSHL